MKSTKSNRFSLLLATSGLIFSGALHAQTVEINPAAAIPATYTLAQGWEWNTPADLQSWTANAGLTLEAGTPTDDGGGNGSVKGTAANNDPSFTSPVTTIATPYRVIIEMRVKKESTDTTRMDLFWDDTAGGIGTAGKLVSILPATLAPDNTFKIVRITLPINKIVGQLDQLRFDPISDAAGLGKTVAIDYLRVYTEVPTPLSWDTDTVTTDAQGGTGTWDQLTNNLWWNGAANTTWPASGARAIFGGTAGTVTVAAGGVSANIADFQTTGYTITGGAISIGSDSAKFTNGVATNITRIDAPLTGSAPLLLTGGTFVLGGNNTSLSGPVTQLSKLGITNNNAVGTGTLTMGASNNMFISALDGDRTIANNVVFSGNRMVIDNDAYLTGLSVGNLTIDGNLALNCTSPADLFLRKNLTVNGVVSGSNSNIGLLLASNVGTIKLTNAGNNFTGNITWAIGATVEASSNGALGDLTNSLKFNVTGTLKMLAAFNGTHPLVINNFGTGTAGTSTTLAQLDTNGFDSTWTGTISAPVFSAPAVAQQITTFVKQGAGILTLDSGGTTANNLRSGGIRVDGGTLKIASGVITTLQSSTANGVNGGSVLEINGGSLSTGNFAVGKSAGTATFTLNSGTYTNTAEFLPAFNLGDGIITINGGLADLNQFSMVDKAGLTSTMNLNGGEVRLNFFNARANVVLPAIATANINFNGSLVKAKTNQTDFIETNTTTIVTASVQTGGAIFDTSASGLGVAVTIKQPLVHDAALGATPDGGLTKSGLGTLTLAPVAGPNTYTGPTTVNAGILAVSGTSIADAGKVLINTSGKLSIPASTNETVATLFLDGVQQPAGVYGSSASTATPGFQNDTFFDVAGAGTLTVTSGAAASGYASWASAFSSPALSNTAATADPDGDGLANSVEYIIGGDPRVSSQSGRPTSTASAGNLVFTFSRVDSSETSDVTLKVQTSNDLADWSTQPSFTIGATTAASTAGVVVTENGAAADTITVTIPGAARKFARLTVITTP